jgi:hypothetical protein
MAAGLLFLSGCSSYEGVMALHRGKTSQDELPSELKFLETKAGSPKNFRLLSEDKGVKYFASESEDFTGACLALYPVNRPTQWHVSCSQGISADREIVTATGPDGASAKFVTTGFDTGTLEKTGWRKIHENILLGS